MSSGDLTKPKPDGPPAADQVLVWLTEGKREADIRQAIAAFWPTESADGLLLKAIEHFEGAADCPLKRVVGWAMEAYRDLYRRMIDIGDFANAMRAVKELEALAEKHCPRGEPDEDAAADDSPQTELLPTKPKPRTKRQPRAGAAG